MILDKLFKIYKSKDAIVARLLEEKHITPKEAATLLKDGIKIHVDNMEMSSGAKIIGGSYIEEKNE